MLRDDQDRGKGRDFLWLVGCLSDWEAGGCCLIHTPSFITEVVFVFMLLLLWEAGMA